MTRRILNIDPSLLSRELAELEAELAAIPASELEPIRLDIMAAVGTALATIDDVKPFRDRIAAELGEGAALYVDRLENAALAAGAANALHLTKVHGTHFEDLINELGQTRRILGVEAQSLVAKKKLAATSLAELVGGTGYQAMCLDVLQLVAAMRTNWVAIESATPVTLAELARAEKLAQEVSTVLGDHGQSASPETADLRSRAYTYFVRTYDEVRRAMSFMRWDENDVDDFVPSLFAGRGRKKDDDDVVEPAAPVVAPVVAPIVDGSNGAPTNGVTPTPAPIPPGMPGAPPFTE